MAAGFKKATVNASDVPSTQSNFPAYVDLSRLGITTLAEAQSVRVYADSDKTTEWAREIVSATEMHTKIPTFTSTTDIYVDWDGVRADYGVTDTYGRNAVWSDYEAVYHMNESSGNLTDSTGNGNTGVANGTPTYSATGQLGSGITFGSGDYFVLGSNIETAMVSSGEYTMQGWIKHTMNTTNDTGWFFGVYDNLSGDDYVLHASRTLGKFGAFQRQTGGWYSTVSAYNDNSWHYVLSTYDQSNVRIVVDDAENITNSVGAKTLTTNTANWEIGRVFAGKQYLGSIDEIRARASSLSDNWITTEYNNQSDEATFWGTWSNVGGAPTVYNALALCNF